MKRGNIWLLALGLGLLLVLALAPVACASADVVINEANFPDAAFREYVLYWCDRGYEVYDEKNDEWIIVNANDGVLCPEEIAECTGLNPCNLGIKSLAGIEHFTYLESLACYTNQLTSLDVSECTALEYLNCGNNQLTSLNISGLTSLETLECHQNQLTSLDVSGYSNLRGLSCENNYLTSLNVRGCSALSKLWCYDNRLTSLDVSNSVLLWYLDCSVNQLTSLNTRGCTALMRLHCIDNRLTDLHVSGLAALEDLWCDENQLTNLDVSNNPALFDLDCGKNQLTSLDVSNNTNLVFLICESNQLTDLDVSGNLNLVSLSCDNNLLTSLNVSSNSNLEYIGCANNRITSLDVSGLYNLFQLDCWNNGLTSLNISGCPEIAWLMCYDNMLQSLDVSGCPLLEHLRCHNNMLQSLDVSGCPLLEHLRCHNNMLQSLDVSGCPLLEYLHCHNNQLTILDLSNNTNLLSGRDYLSVFYANISHQNPPHAASCVETEEGYVISLLDLPFISNENISRYTAQGQHGEYGKAGSYRFSGVMNDEQGTITFTQKPDYLVLVYDTGSPYDISMEDILIPVKIAPPIAAYDDGVMVEEFMETFGSFSWEREDGKPMDYSKLTLRLTLDERQFEENDTAEFMLPDGFSFERDAVTPEIPVPLSEARQDENGKYILEREIYPQYSEAYREELVWTAYLSRQGEVGRETVSSGAPVYENQLEGKAYFPPTRGISAQSLNLVETPFELYPVYDFTSSLSQYEPRQARFGVTMGVAAYNESGLRASLRNGGFDRFEWHASSGMNGVAHAFATKTIVAEDEVKTVVMIAVRGTVGIEWEGNFLINGMNGNIDHTGFNMAATEVLENFNSYCEKHDLAARNTRAFVCGHSRGGAVSNLVAHRLIGGSLVDEVNAYTCATPGCTQNPVAHAGIYNIVYLHDVIGYIPAGYGKHGRSYVIGVDSLPREVGIAYYNYMGVPYRRPNQPFAIYVMLHSQEANGLITACKQMLGKIANTPESEHKDLAVAHCPENYLSWINNAGVSMTYAQACERFYTLNVGDSAKLGLNVALISGLVRANPIGAAFVGGLYMLSVRCPVDVEVLDEAGGVIATIEAHSVQDCDESKAAAVAFDREDYVALPFGGQYTLRIVGTDEGSMDINIYNITDEMTLTGEAAYRSVAVTRGGEATLSLTTGAEDAVINCTLMSGGRIIPPAGAARLLRLPENLKAIASQAFAGCTALDEVMIPENVDSIAADAFGTEKPTLLVVEGSYAHQFAVDNNIPFELVN